MSIEDALLKSVTEWAKGQANVILADLRVPRGLTSLVFSSPKGQCPLSSIRFDIYRDFPSFFDTGSAQSKISSLIGELGQLGRHKKDDEAAVVLDKVLLLLGSAPVASDVAIEFRFERLDADLILQMKKHPLVRQPLEMMRPAWIRVVLRSFAEAKAILESSAPGES